MSAHETSNGTGHPDEMTEAVKHSLSWVHHVGGYGWTCACGKGSPDAFHRTGLAALAAGRRHIRADEDHSRKSRTGDK